MLLSNFSEWLKSKNYNDTYVNELYSRLLDIVDLGIECSEDIVRDEYWYVPKRYRRSFMASIRKFMEYVEWSLNGGVSNGSRGRQ